MAATDTIDKQLHLFTIILNQCITVCMQAHVNIHMCH